ncbi:glycosyl hydrolase [Paenibacillus chitinolyticus]|uniref:Glycoside hydrolase family 3 C-terminal domain-containing protein n=1 Tax=Paenibacillus chitinolyticus TaxID=79263 RepID=A0A410WXU1_9BACL|nr:glycoside hydrolase family 3 C-terminal domain-containing protein [Paenibacillus chitinolyticus]MCY9589872.1 glycoside hydrolase family 3 C-terminal domain-containing protein [Paenibacillus chitinolyticus]MCY9598127.1 glycoside hydrolase family 3 C-terminal domain-containing protein [Paenibacillus chitinolyticus]QAV19245.1 glycosyl hydrolase [Paenibacillus chitinolyticus]
MKDRIKQLISQLTLEEKAGLCSGLDFWHTKGVERLGIPSIMLTDGPHGLRKQKGDSDHLGIMDSVPSTCFPSGAGLACSWDRDLIRKVGEALGVECQAEDVGILLGPAANIKRSPLCGRNFEYFSEDPYLSTEMAANHIAGVQSQGVGTSLKHYAVNNQEHRRMSVDAVVDERTLREIYLSSFEGAVKQAQPWTVMCAYNKVNGEYCSENKYLLNDILKEEWGLEGFVVSDWGAVDERVPGLLAGLELEMPSSNGAGDRKIVEAVRNGSMSEDIVDQAVERILTIVFRAAENKKTVTFNQEEHHQLAREAARESMVLLKNERRILPLSKDATICVIGAFAQQPRYQGGGSSRIKPMKLDNIYEELAKKVSGQALMSFAKGYNLEDDEIDEQLVKEAVEAAGKSQVTVIFAGLPDRYESEAYDRGHLRIPDNQMQLIDAIAEVQQHIVVVLSNGAPIEMPWIDKVQGVLEGYLGGQALGGAIADLLFGDANPCGKLAETFPQKLSHNPSYLNFPGEGDTVEYSEGLFVGYRYYDKKEIEPLFPFGHGLSYTTFEYTDLKLNRQAMLDTDQLQVSLKVKNAGDVAGKEIVQLYVRDVESTVSKAFKELKGFSKIALQPGEEKTVRFILDKRAFAYYNTDIRDWHVESGDYEIMIGQSAAEIRLKETVQIQSTVLIRRTYTRNTTIGDLMADPYTADIVKQFLRGFKGNPLFSAANDEGTSEMFAAILKFMPLRAAAAFSQGAFTEEMLNHMVERLNGTGSDM